MYFVKIQCVSRRRRLCTFISSANWIDTVKGREVLLQKFFPPLHKLSEQLPPPIIVELLLLLRRLQLLETRKEGQTMPHEKRLYLF